MISKSDSFSSKRLKYRGIVRDDAEKIVSWRSDPGIYRHLFRGEALSLEEHLAWFQRYLEDPTRYDFMILDEEDHRIGTVSLTDIEDGACDISYIIGEKAKRGRGYAKEAIEAVTEFAFDMGIELVYARILARNRASKRVAVACGFKEEQSVFCLRSGTRALESADRIMSDAAKAISASGHSIVICTHKEWNKRLARELSKIMSRHGVDVELIANPNELSADRLNGVDPMYIFFPHWSYIIPEDVYANHECVVFHMTDLPYGRGGSPLQNLIVAGFDSTMISAIKVVGELDAGPVYMKEPLSLEGSAREIYERAAEVIFGVMIPRILTCGMEATSQEGDVVEFRRRKPHESEVPLGSSLMQFNDHIRMLDAEGYPPAFIRYGDKILRFSNAQLIDGRLTAEVEIAEDEK